MTAEFLAALVFGAVVIIVFARDQFRRPSYGRSQELERLIEFLEPPDLRNNRVYWFASSVYTGILLIIYLLLCVYGTVPILQALGIFSEFEGSDTILIPAVPLGISLAVVGLAPGLPVLQNFEEKIRFAAHSLSGIPAWLLHGCRILQNRSIGLPEERHGYLIPERDWERIYHYRRYGKAMLDDPDGFAENIAKIIAYRNWIARKKLNSTLRSPRAAILRKGEDIEKRIDRIILSLDSLSGFNIQALPEQADDLTRASWASLAKEANNLCSRICGLLMLQVEHGLITPSPNKVLHAPKVDPDTKSAQLLLAGFLEGVEVLGRETALVGRLWGLATVAAVATTFLWAISVNVFWSFLKVNDGIIVLPRALMFSLSSALMYAPAIFVALSLHGRRFWADTSKVRWPGMVADDWASCVWPATLVFSAAALSAAVPAIAFNQYVAFSKPEIAFGFDEITNRFWPGLRAALISELPRAMVVPILAMGVVASVDAWRAANDGSKDRSRSVIVCTIFLMTLWTPIATLLSEQWKLSVNCSQVNACDVQSLGAILRGMWLHLALGAIRSALIGFCVLYVCQASLMRRSANNVTEKHNRSWSTNYS